MTLFQMKWLRRLVRRNTNAIPEFQAVIWKRRLSIAYGILAWNALAFVGYMICTGRNDWADYHGLKSNEDKDLSPGMQFSKILNVERGKVVTIKGFTKTKETEFDNTKNMEN